MIIACLLNPFDVRGGAQNIRRVWTDDFVSSGAAASESRRVSDSESWQSPGCWADSGLLTCPVLSQGAHILFLALGGHFAWLSGRLQLRRGKFYTFTQNVRQVVTVQ